MVAEVKTDLKEDIQEIKIRIQKIEKELAILRWMVVGVFIFCVSQFLQNFDLLDDYVVS